MNGGGTSFTNRYHAGGFVVIFCDGHAKWTRYENTFRLNSAGRLEWIARARAADPERT